MRTEHSWTEVGRGLVDLRALLAFRSAGLNRRSRRRLRIAGGTVLLLTVAAIVVPAYLRAPLHSRDAGKFVAILPTLYLGFLVLAVLAAIASGGGREVVPREQAVAFPVSSVTEHFGALLLAPLNIAWLLQAWTIIALTTYVVGPTALVAAAVPLLAWIGFATALGQALGWVFEGIRRGPHGILVARLIAATAIGAVVVVVLADQLVPLLDRSPTVQVYLAAAYPSGHQWTAWAQVVAVLLAMLVGATLLGLLPARWALHRPLREELRLESGHIEPRPNPRSDLRAMVRIDRASIWRAVPLRRGLIVLAFMPGLVALAGRLEWDMVTILPGLVASGGALLFGVNTWCLDGRGALWRDSLPVSAGIAYYAKVIVLFEVLLAAAGFTIMLAALRAGTPTAAELCSALAAAVVVASQVVATSMRWSVERPYAMDMRSARATPAPPVVMAGYSARLALRTTVVGLLFSATALADSWTIPALVAVPLLSWSAVRLVRTAAQWAVPEVRARVVSVVAT
ncbi:hypothetical protein [Nocardioides pocheonensis]|uniref:ABC-2 type transport system permease protein n=1 Tax=Nocardioides pocheonensis TaxID=661485 RepID=A0A3N0GJY3_9ACTN|nr:hypothetical protein [Nocardioides pocheonensis]RNM12482.1 hypothetical protein EFL26_17750 [Nocardioides pocheonensis]